MSEGHAALAPIALAFFIGILVSQGTDILKIKVTSTFGQLIVAWFIGFVLAHIITRYLDGAKRPEKFDRFPPPLVKFTAPTGNTLLPYTQGRDYIPHNMPPTAPPGPKIPADKEDPFSSAWDTIAPASPSAAPMTPAPATTPPTAMPRPANAVLPSKMKATWIPQATPKTKLAYPMTEGDDIN
jgi:hypothetical protein